MITQATVMRDIESMRSGVCTVSVDVLEGGLLRYQVRTVYLASRDLHARRVVSAESFTDPGDAIERVAAFVHSYQPRPGQSRQGNQ
jgi:hypothetical protein